MIEVSVLFILISFVVFLGYILNALFYRLKVSNVLPLLIIGLLLGPILHFVDTGPSSIVAQISPFVTAIAIAFVLFDVGMNIRIASLKEVILKSSSFTIITSVITGAAMSLILFYSQGWSVLAALMAGFAISGTSSIILPSLLKVIKVSENLKTSFVYQSVFNDIFCFVIPLIFFNILSTGTYTFSFVFLELARFVIGSVLLGLLFACIWIFILRTFRKHSSEYSWMLTLTIVLGVYGLSEALQFNGALSTFIFGILLTNIPDLKFVQKSYIRPVLEDISHIKIYQKEITFFVSTFFFVYIGMLFDPQGPQYLLIGLAVFMSVIMLIVRHYTSRMLKNIIVKGKHQKSEKSITEFYVAQGLAPAIIATLPATAGIVVPNLIDVMFLVIFVTNAILSIGLYRYAKIYQEEEGK